MEKQYKEIPKQRPETGTFYCPWCATKQSTHMHIFTVYCCGCGRKLTHDGKNVKMPTEAELKACSDEQLLFMIQQYCTFSNTYNLAQIIMRAVPDRKNIVFAAAEVLWSNKATSDEGWKMLLKLAEEKHYDALATIYNAYLTDDLKYQSQLKKYSEILVREFGDQTAADTLRTIIRKEGGY